MFPHLSTVISTALRFHLFTASLSSPCHSLLNHCVQRPSQKGFVCHWRLLDPHFRTMVASRFYQAQTRPSSSASAPTWGTLCGCRSDGIRIWVGEALWAQQWEVMDSSPMCHLPDPACVFSSLMVAFEQIDCQSDCPVWVTGAKWQRVELGSLWMFLSWVFYRRTLLKNHPAMWLTHVLFAWQYLLTLPYVNDSTQCALLPLTYRCIEIGHSAYENYRLQWAMFKRVIHGTAKQAIVAGM